LIQEPEVISREFDMKETFASFVKNKLINFIETSSKSSFSTVSINGPALKILIKKSDINLPSIPLPSVSIPVTSDEEVVLQEYPLQIEEIKSYWVGSFHQSKEAVRPGDKIEAGQMLGSVKCMNLLFEIKSPVDGTLLEVLVKDDEIVEYGKVLFKISLIK